MISVAEWKQVCSCLRANERAPGCSCACWSDWFDCCWTFPWRWRTRCAPVYWQHFPFHPGNFCRAFLVLTPLFLCPILCCWTIFLFLTCCYHCYQVLIVLFFITLNGRQTLRCLLSLDVFHLLWDTNQLLLPILEDCKSGLRRQRRVLLHLSRLFMCLLMIWRILLLLPPLPILTLLLCCHDRFVHRP